MDPSDFVRDPLMCFICASTSHDAEGGQVDSELKTVYAVVLLICATRKSEGGNFCWSLSPQWPSNLEALGSRAQSGRNKATWVDIF